ncbi:MAG: hypothetical protein CMO74_00490 [Verrucomicrobiales bacterium]|nr:hypothetical protein [Verrucomicrobiales bacterium]|tara:strand:- start:213 stop:617 length:405 start_codon:yes stop_codon:yes gene_type:complete
MSDIAEFVHHNAARVTPKILQGIHAKLPQLKLEFAEIHAPKFPHLVDQLEFLADVVEDYAENADGDLPYFTIAEACFTLAYAHKQLHLIPDTTPDVGYADESSVTRTVLIENEKVLSEYARRHGIDWAEVTTQA